MKQPVQGVFGVPFPIVIAVAALTGWTLHQWRPALVTRQDAPRRRRRPTDQALSPDIERAERAGRRRAQAWPGMGEDDGVRMVATDLDGTVVRVDGSISPRTLAALDACE